MQSIGKATVAACHFFAVIDAPFPKDGACKDPHVSLSRDIVFDKVTFAYPSRPDVKILDQLSLTIQAGKSTAIVGPSGFGKSTIVALIQRWYTLQQQHVIPQAAQQGKRREKAGPEKDEISVGGNGDGGTREDLDRAEPSVGLQGSVTVDGCPIDDVDVKWWRARIGLVQQEPFLFNDTIYENVARGLVGTEWETLSESFKKNLVKDACEEAFAHEFIEKLTPALRHFLLEVPRMTSKVGLTLQRSHPRVLQSLLRDYHLVIAKLMPPRVTKADSVDLLEASVCFSWNQGLTGPG